MCEKMRMTRRAFLETAALAAAGLTLGACAPRQEGKIAAQTFGCTGHQSTRVIFGGYAFSSVTDKERVRADDRRSSGVRRQPHRYCPLVRGLAHLARDGDEGPPGRVLPGH